MAYADDRQVDRESDPESLPGGERMRELTEPDRGRRVAHEVEGLKEADPCDVAVRVDPWDQRQADRALTEKMTMRVIRGARMRRITMKIVEDAWLDDWMWARDGTRLADLRLPNRVQKTAAGYSLLPQCYPRWKVTVSVTSRTTETRLASRAPPDSETILAVWTAVQALRGDLDVDPPRRPR